MTRSWELVKAFGRFWYGFIIGDDWTAAAGVVVVVLGTYGLLALGMPAWWSVRSWSWRRPRSRSGASSPGTRRPVPDSPREGSTP